MMGYLCPMHAQHEYTNHWLRYGCTHEHNSCEQEQRHARDVNGHVDLQAQPVSQKIRGIEQMK